MSQQGFTIVSVQLVDIIQVIQEMGDIEYLSKKEFDGKRRDDEVLKSNGATGAGATLTANTGKDMYVAKAKISWEVSTGNTELVVISLRLNGVIVESYRGRGDVADAHGYEFVNIGGKVAAGEVIEIFIESSEFNLDVETVLVCFEEDTGADPTILASSITVDATVAGDTGDLAFIQSKILSGDSFQVSGDISTLNDTIEFIPATGKTAFLVEAKITIPTNPSTAGISPGASATDQTVADLKIDTVVKDKAKIGVSSKGDQGPGSSDGRGGNGISFLSTDRFDVKTLSLVGDGIKKIEIENVLSAGNAFATMAGYVINT